ncbi:MAG: MFS transporter, partial [Candidatus Aenigmarchaeota archaeon]|nr:MFS transporter [Candidatus Aenigmarchaeota archaeon]
MNENTKKFAIITIISALNMVGGSFLAPIEVRFLQTLTSNTTLIGLTYSFGAIFFAFLSIYMGRLSATYGKKRFITTGAIAGIFYPLLFANTINVFQYMGVKLIWAFAGASTGPLLAAYLQDALYENKKKGTFLGVFHSIHAIAGSMGALVGGYLSDAYNLATPYYAGGYFLVIPALISIIFIGFKNDTKEKPVVEKRSILFSMKYVLSKPILIFHIILNTAFGLNWNMKIIIYPLVIYG